MSIRKILLFVLLLGVVNCNDDRENSGRILTAEELIGTVWTGIYIVNDRGELYDVRLEFIDDKNVRAKIISSKNETREMKGTYVYDEITGRIQCSNDEGEMASGDVRENEISVRTDTYDFDGQI